MTIHTLQGIAGVLAVHQAVLAALICSIGRDDAVRLRGLRRI